MSNNANMKIVCKTERAYANTTAVLNFIGSGEYIADDEKKTIELNVSIWHYSQLIEIIHSQFKEELGERAYRNEIKFYDLDGCGNESEISKKDEKSEQHPRRLHFVFGELASKHADDFEELLDDLSMMEGDFITREFKTEAEENAYLQALSDFDGWDGYSVLEDLHNGDDIEEFSRKYDEMMESENS